MSKSESPTTAAEVVAAVPLEESAAANAECGPTADANAQTNENHPSAADEKSEAEELPLPPSAMKGKSGRSRSADLRLRFNPDVTVVETPSYVLVMNTDEDEDEGVELAIFDRLYDEARLRAERVKKVEQSEIEKSAKEDLECTFKPEVSDAAKALGKYPNWREFLKSQDERKKTFEMHFRKKKDKIISDERIPLFEDMPRKHSLKIIAYLEKERKYSGPITGWRERFRKYMTRLREQETDSLLNSSNRSDTQSVHSGVVRDDTIFDRLYEEANVRVAAQRVMLLTQLEKEARELFHPLTNESYHWPSERRATTTEYGDFASSSCLSTTRSCCSTVFDDLYAKSEEYQRRREARAIAAAASQEEYSFRPTTNPQSRRIIMERAIARAKGELPQRQQTEQRAASALGPRGPPRRFHADIFCSRLQRKELERAERIAALRRESLLEEFAECTFRPSISRRSVAIAEQKGYGRVAFARAAPTGPRVDAFRTPRVTTQEEERTQERTQERTRERVKERLEGHARMRPSGDIDSLASELQGVLSAWAEVVEEAQAAF